MREEDGTQLAERFEQVALNDEVDEKLGFGRVSEGPRREGWLINMHPVSMRAICFVCHADGAPDIGEGCRLAFRKGRC